MSRRQLTRSIVELIGVGILSFVMFFVFVFGAAGMWPFSIICVAILVGSLHYFDFFGDENIFLGKAQKK